MYMPQEESYDEFLISITVNNQTRKTQKLSHLLYWWTIDFEIIYWF